MRKEKGKGREKRGKWKRGSERGDQREESERGEQRQQRGEEKVQFWFNADFVKNVIWFKKLDN